MSVMELDAFRAELARTILTTEDYDLLDKIKQLIGLQGKKEDTAKEECGDGGNTGGFRTSMSRTQATERRQTQIQDIKRSSP